MSWFVRNLRDMQWQENELGATAEFDRPQHFDEFGINVTSLDPGNR